MVLIPHLFSLRVAFIGLFPIIINKNFHYKIPFNTLKQFNWTNQNLFQRYNRPLWYNIFSILYLWTGMYKEDSLPPALQLTWMEQVPVDTMARYIQYKTWQDDRFRMDWLISEQRLPLKHRRKTATMSSVGSSNLPDGEKYIHVCSYIKHKKVPLIRPLRWHFFLITLFTNLRSKAWNLKEIGLI